jgi:hypothetical protein
MMMRMILKALFIKALLAKFLLDGLLKVVRADPQIVLYLQKD